MQRNKETSIDDLARMMKNGFDEMQGNFEEMQGNFKELKSDTEELKERTGNIENKVNQIDRRLFSIEEDVSDIKIKQYGDLLKRVNFIERKLGIAKG